MPKINFVAYQLNLQKFSTMHPYFHVSLLGQALSTGTLASPNLPPETNLLG
jgi:hypothetical protein